MHQVELHPYLQQWDLKKFCEQNGIYMTAYYPLGGARNMSSDDAVIKHPTIVSIANKHNKTPAQILIRWCIQRGVVCIPKSVHANRIEENGNVFDFELTSEEMELIRAMDRHLRYSLPTIILSSQDSSEAYFDNEDI